MPYICLLFTLSLSFVVDCRSISWMDLKSAGQVNIMTKNPLSSVISFWFLTGDAHRFCHWLSTNQIRVLNLPLPGTSFWSLKEIIGMHFMMAATTHRTPWLKTIILDRKWWLQKMLSKECISPSLKPYICLTYTKVLCFVRVASLRPTDWRNLLSWHSFSRLTSNQRRWITRARHLTESRICVQFFSPHWDHSDCVK